MSGVVRRVDVNQLNLTGIGFLKKLKGIEVITFNIEVFSGVPINALLRAWNHGFADRTTRFRFCLALARPGKLISLTLTFSDVTEQITQGVEVYCTFQLAFWVFDFSCHLREQIYDFLDVLIGDIGRSSFDLLHASSFHERVLFAPSFLQLLEQRISLADLALLAVGALQLGYLLIKCLHFLAFLYFGINVLDVD